MDGSANATGISSQVNMNRYYRITYSYYHVLISSHFLAILSKGSSRVAEMVIRQAMSLMERVIKNGLSAGKDPMGIAGAVLYNCMVLNGMAIRQRDTAAAPSVTEVILRTRANHLKNTLDLN